MSVCVTFINWALQISQGDELCKEIWDEHLDFIWSGCLVKYDNMIFQAKLLKKGRKKPVEDWIVPGRTTVKALHSM